MQQSDLMDVLVLEKRLYGKLNEVMDITGQMAEALDRQDKISIQLLLAMRQEPIDQLREADESLKKKQVYLNDDDQARLEEVLGGAAPLDEYERMVAEQAGANRRLLERVVALDQRVNRRLGGGDSCYAE